MGVSNKSWSSPIFYYQNLILPAKINTAIRIAIVISEIINTHSHNFGFCLCSYTALR